MPNQKSFTASQLRYLLAMKELDGDGSGIRSVKMASVLGLSKPSVHTMLNTFREMGLIQKSSYGIAYFTEAGLDVVARYGHYYELVSRLMAIHFPPDEYLQMAICAFLAEIPEERLKELCHTQEGAIGSFFSHKAGKTV